jgi:hypothetical protein
MKVKAFLEKVNNQAKIANEDFKKSLETMPDAEIPDVWVNVFEENFLTRERAAADTKIINKIRAEVLDGVDVHLESYKTFLDAKDVERLDAEKDSFKKLKILKEAIPAALEKVKKDNPDANEQVKELKKNYQEVVDKIAAQKSEFEAKELELKKQFETKEQSLKLDWTLEKEFGKYTFADEHSKIKDAIVKIATTELKSKHALGFGENGQLQVQEIANGIAKQKFNGNDPVTVDSLLKEILDPYLKKNNADDGKRPDASGRKTFEPPKQPGSGTLAEIRKAARTV